MNLLHLKYAVEVGKARSITKAAENLYINQPNLSRAIKDLEESLGVTIFNRTSKGITPTAEGEEFLTYARSILSQIDEVEEMYKTGDRRKQRFSVSVPRAGYIAEAFGRTIKHLDPGRKAEIYYKETNSMRALNNLLCANYHLGIIRYRVEFERHFADLLYEKGLKSSVIREYDGVLLMSLSHPLAHKDTIAECDLDDLLEIAYGDPYVPSVSIVDVRRTELPETTDQRIFVFERESAYTLLADLPGSYMWTSPEPERFLRMYGLTQKSPCAARRYKDVLVYHKDYRLSELDRLFLDELGAYANEI